MKIRQKMFLATAVPVTMIWMVSYYSNTAGQRLLRENIEQDAMTFTQAVMGEVDRTMHIRVDTWVRFSDDALIQGSLEISNEQFSRISDPQALIDDRDVAWQEQSMDELSPLMIELQDSALSAELRSHQIHAEEDHRYTVFPEVFVTNRYGANIAQTNRTSDYRQDDEEWWISARRDGLHVTDLEYDESSDTYSVAICVRIDNEQGDFVGILKAILNLEEVIDTLNARSINRGGSHAGFTLLTSERKIIHDTNHHFGGMSVSDHFPANWDATMQSHQAGNPVLSVVEFEDPESNEVVMCTFVVSEGFGTFKSLGWTLMFERKSREIFGPAHVLYRNILLLSLAGTLVTLLLGGLIGFPMSRRVRQLAKAATAVGRGERGVHIGSSGNDEIAHLALEFNQMSIGLDLSKKGLEEQTRIIYEKNTLLELEVTERKQVEEALRENEAKFQAITTAAQDAIVMMDHEGKVAYWNKAAERIFGWTEEEVMGGVLHEFIASTQLRDAHNKAFPAFLKTGEGAAIGRTVELPALRKDGTEIPVELSLSAFRLNGEWHAIGLARDISQRVENERSQARLNAAIEAATETIVITDAQGVIQYANPAFERSSGYSLAEVIGKTSKVFSSGEHDHAFHLYLWETISRGKVWHDRFTNRKKDGTLYYEEATISPITDETGKIVNYVAVKRDVTQELVMERQLQQAQKLESIGQLAAGIAHEINTPIQYVGDNTRFIRDSIDDIMNLVDQYSTLFASAKRGEASPEQFAVVESKLDEVDLEFVKEEIPKAIEQTLEGVGRVAKIVRAMKDFSHPGSEEKTPMDLNKAIESTITVCHNRWKYVADLETEFEDGLPPVPCLVGEFNQVILNIIVNAADAIAGISESESSSQGKIRISTHLRGKQVEIRVSDTGGGIPKEIRQKVFDPFFTTKEVGKGTGQGLAICHDVIVKKHGGTIDIETEVGKGSTFIIRMPLEAEPALETKEAA